ncbi:hypothetical protein J2128_002300 [Methanomicrobium sp. W14]|uniref:hypothetical protein n=1 Tax=Methanomicrobium sp. W14 TaxID=2817839 RepID=UPI001AE4D781|nr:hypothetical protein [Methanomicrobium sp. W14]MBP2134334.1 hypothetical protein [Methanomicrobium sp. W14]
MDENKSSVGIYEGGVPEFDKKGIIFANIILIAWLLAGIYAVYVFYPPAGIVYGLFVIIMFMFVMRKGLCTKCWYYGKKCSMGWGVYTAKLFRKDDTEKFEGCKASKFAPVLWMTVSFLPVVLILVSAVLSFSVFKLIILAVLVILMAISGNKKIREASCRQCKMRYLCHGSAAKD